MYKMNHTYRCENCNAKWDTKKTYELHSTMCNAIHISAKEREIDQEIEIPSQAAMFQHIVYLTKKCEDLEKKLAKLQITTTNTRRKNIKEYLQSIPDPKMEYSDWISSIQVADYHLQKVFEHDLDECIKQVLTPLLSDMPIRAFTQKPSTLYIYVHSEWREMSAEEMTAFVKSISREILRTYTRWSKEHHAEMHANAKMQELSMIYIKKVNGLDGSQSARTSHIKKWVFSNIAVSLEGVEF